MVAMRDETGLKYLLSDHLGSLVAITDDSGTLITQQRYLPFGGERTDVPSPQSAGTDYGYTGQRNLDPGMGGLMDYRARFFSPTLGRFIQPDTIVPNPFDPQSWNRFSYVRNNPVRYTDPTGHWIDEGCGTGGAEGGTGCTLPKPKPGGWGGGGGGSLGKNDGHNRDCALFDRLCRKMVEAEKTADKDFNPFTGAFKEDNYSIAMNYFPGGLPMFDALMTELYIELNVDLEKIAGGPQPNPVTVKNFLDSRIGQQIGVDALYARVFQINSKHVPYILFLKHVGLPVNGKINDDNVMNYESNYLDALMRANTSALREAKKEYIFRHLLVEEDGDFYHLFGGEGYPFGASGGPPYE